MSKVYVKCYDRFVLSGQDFAPVSSNDMRRIVFSPDGRHSISVVDLRDGTLLFTNETKTPFEFTISMNRRVAAVVKCSPAESTLKINSNWVVSRDGVQNYEIHNNPDLFMSTVINVDIEFDGVARVDVKVNDSGCACCIFGEKDLLFVRMNGNHAHPKLMQMVEHEINRAPANFERVMEYMDANPNAAKNIGQRFFADWATQHEWGMK